MKIISTTVINLRALLADERGTVSAISMILLTVLLALGAIVGLVFVRDQVVQEFGDVAVGLDNLDHSFSYEIVVDGVVAHQGAYADDPATLFDSGTAANPVLVLGIAPPGESGSKANTPNLFP